MQFLEIKDGFSVNTAEIEAIERISEYTSKVYTKYNSYETNFPYLTLLQILEGEVTAPNEQEDILDKLSKTLDYHQHFAG